MIGMFTPHVGAEDSHAIIDGVVSDVRMQQTLNHRDQLITRFDRVTEHFTVTYDIDSGAYVIGVIEDTEFIHTEIDPIQNHE